jgi:outer membrane biosynthesis protein TonB
MTLTDDQKRGIVSTTLFHAVILLILIFLGLSNPVPNPQEEGITIDFGYSVTGLGEIEPSAAQAPEQSVLQVKESAAAKPVVPKQTPSKSDQDGEEELLTQEIEKTVAVKTGTKKKVVDDSKAKLEAERKRQEQIEKEQLRKEELEKQRLEEEARLKQAEEQKKIGTINSRAKNAFGGGKTDNGSQSSGQGVTYGPGNQGSPDGTPGANQYGLGGGSGNGISFSLSGRSARSLPKPEYPGNDAGIVVVEVTVDKYGKVTNARAGIKGSTTSDPDLLDAARRAAILANFNSDENAPAFQKGTITYRFVLQ